MTIWTSKSAEKATKGTSNKIWNGNKLVIDSRLIEKDDIFIALKGETSDGHKYIDQAFANGASAAIISKDIAINPQYPILKVKDTYKALCDMAKFKRNNVKANFIGITGSVGKTSTKDMLNLALKQIAKTAVTRGNYNNHVGLPVSLASIPDDAKFVILEMAMNSKDEISFLSKIAKPTYSIITSIEPCHIEYFDSLKDIAFAKAEIMDGMEKNSFLLINEDSNYPDLLKQLAKEKEIRVYGCSAKKNMHIETYENKVKVIVKEQTFTCQYLMQEIPMQLIQNSIFIVYLCKELGVDLDKALTGLLDFKPLKGRGAKFLKHINNCNITLIDESYNSSPTALKKSIINLGKERNRKIAILADMKELGDRSAQYHIELHDTIIQNQIDKVITYGKYMNMLFETLPESVKLKNCNSLEEVLQTLLENLNNNDFILIKGSLSTNIKQIVEKLLQEEYDS